MTARIVDLAARGIEWEAAQPGWVDLGSVVLGAASSTLGTVSWASWGINFDLLLVQGRIQGYASTDRPRMTFNGSATGYTDRWLTAAAAAGTFTNAEAASATGIRWAANDVTTGRVVTCLIANSGTEKRVILEDDTGSGSAATQHVHHHLGQGTWNNANPITSISVQTVGGANFTAGTGMVVWGARAAFTDGLV